MNQFILEIAGKFLLTRLDNNSWWLTNKDGEGMQVRDSELEKLFEKFWKEHF